MPVGARPFFLNGSSVAIAPHRVRFGICFWPLRDKAQLQLFYYSAAARAKAGGTELKILIILTDFFGPGKPCATRCPGFGVGQKFDSFGQKFDSK